MPDHGARAAEDAAGPFLAALRAQPHDLPLTSRQEHLLHRLATAPDRRLDPVAVAFRVSGPLSIDLLGCALTEAVHRHPALRSRFRPVEDGGPGLRRLVLDEQPTADLAVYHVPDATDREVDALLLAERDRPTDLAAGPMARLAAVTRTPDDHVVLLALHPLVADEPSLDVLLHELDALHGTFRAGQPAPPLPPGPGYRELAERVPGRQATARAHVAALLAGAPEALDPFPGREFTETSLSAVHSFTVPAAQAAALGERATKLGATPFQAVVALWSGVLAARSGRSDLLLLTSAPVPAPRVVGCFAQPLPVRIDASAAPDFPALLSRARTGTALAALVHQPYPSAEFAPRTRFAARLRYRPRAASTGLPGLACTPWELPDRSTAHPVPGGDPRVPELTVTERPDGTLHCQLRHNAHAFAPATVAALAESFTTALTAAAA